MYDRLRELATYIGENKPVSVEEFFEFWYSLDLDEQYYYYTAEVDREELTDAAQRSAHNPRTAREH